jgi:hypothetical protein
MGGLVFGARQRPCAAPLGLLLGDVELTNALTGPVFPIGLDAHGRIVARGAERAKSVLVNAGHFRSLDIAASGNTRCPALNRASAVHHRGGHRARSRAAVPSAVRATHGMVCAPFPKLGDQRPRTERTALTLGTAVPKATSERRSQALWRRLARIRCRSLRPRCTSRRRGYARGCSGDGHHVVVPGATVLLGPGAEELARPRRGSAMGRGEGCLVGRGADPSEHGARAGRWAGPRASMRTLMARCSNDDGAPAPA